MGDIKRVADLWLMLMLWCFTKSFWIVSAQDDTNAAALYTADDFSRLVPTKPHLVEFFAPWCGHCQRLSPIYDKLAEKYNGDQKMERVAIAKVDCTVETALCSDNDVIAYPTLLFYWSDPTVYAKFKGKKDFTNLEQFVEKMLLDGPPKQLPDPEKTPTVDDEKEALVELTDVDFESQVASGYNFIKFFAPWCGHCQILAPTWDELANTFKDDRSVTIAKVDCTKFGNICKEQSVRGYPTLIFFNNGRKVTEYHGSRNIEALAEFVRKMKAEQEDLAELASAEIIPDQKPQDAEPAGNNDAEAVDKDDAEPAGTEDAEPTKKEVLYELTDADFESHVSSGHHFVKFYAPWCGFCKKLAPTWVQLAEAFQDDKTLTIAKVDCTKFGDLCKQFSVQGFPTLIFFTNGKKVGQYRGSRDFKDLQKFVQTAKSRTDDASQTPEVGKDEEHVHEENEKVLQLTEENFESQVSSGYHFVKFFAPWCGHCRNLAPTWEKLAEVFENDKSMTIAKVDCTKFRDICGKNLIRSYPTLLFFSKGKAVDRYHGSRSLEDLKEFAEKMRTEQEDLLDADSKDSETAQDTKPEEVPVIALNEKSFEAQLVKGHTFVSFVRAGCESCTSLSPDWVELGRKFLPVPDVYIAEVDCSTNPALCAQNRIESYPTLILYYKGDRVAEYKGSYDLNSLHVFLVQGLSNPQSLESHDEL